jgi:hypothetical protein
VRENRWSNGRIQSQLVGHYNTRVITCPGVAANTCVVSFADVRGIRHAVEVEAESLYEVVVLGVRRLKQGSWIELIGPATVLDVEVRERSRTEALRPLDQRRRVIDSKLDRGYEDFLEGRISDDFWARESKA